MHSGGSDMQPPSSRDVRPLLQTVQRATLPIQRPASRIGSLVGGLSGRFLCHACRASHLRRGLSRQALLQIAFGCQKEWARLPAPCCDRCVLLQLEAARLANVDLSRHHEEPLDPLAHRVLVRGTHHREHRIDDEVGNDDRDDPHGPEAVHPPAVLRNPLLPCCTPAQHNGRPGDKVLWDEAGHVEAVRPAAAHRVPWQAVHSAVELLADEQHRGGGLVHDGSHQEHPAKPAVHCEVESFPDGRGVLERASNCNQARREDVEPIGMVEEPLFGRWVAVANVTLRSGKQDPDMNDHGPEAQVANGQKDPADWRATKFLVPGVAELVPVPIRLEADHGHQGEADRIEGQCGPHEARKIGAQVLDTEHEDDAYVQRKNTPTGL
mmetsp:Transcript_67730/g.136072  ORF Transcript_67730/g.136072 Transcript_67730/m.136072 type:complete len:380 (+) Transcript_67730:117-1256(+)